MKLVWNEVEQGWICSECGAIYGEDEVARMFGYSAPIPDNFEKGYYCMDCGGCFSDVEIN